MLSIIRFRMASTDVHQGEFLHGPRQSTNALQFLCRRHVPVAPHEYGFGAGMSIVQ